jgi:manganese transport protein
MLVLQVIISLTLIFATVPLVHFTSSKAKMGEFVNGWPTKIIAVLLALAIAGLNSYLVIDAIRTNQFSSTVGV